MYFPKQRDNFLYVLFLGPRCIEAGDRRPIGPVTQKPLTIEDLIIPETINANFVVPDGVPLPPDIQGLKHLIESKDWNHNMYLSNLKVYVLYLICGFMRIMGRYTFVDE